MTHVPFDI